MIFKQTNRDFAIGLLKNQKKLIGHWKDKKNRICFCKSDWLISSKSYGKRVENAKKSKYTLLSQWSLTFFSFRYEFHSMEVPSHKLSQETCSPIFYAKISNCWIHLRIKTSFLDHKRFSFWLVSLHSSKQIKWKSCMLDQKWI